jgi:hypothetical protein
MSSRTAAEYFSSLRLSSALLMIFSVAATGAPATAVFLVLFPVPIVILTAAAILATAASAQAEQRQPRYTSDAQL